MTIPQSRRCRPAVVCFLVVLTACSHSPVVRLSGAAPTAPISAPGNIYAADGPNLLSPAVNGVPCDLGGVHEIGGDTFREIGFIRTGKDTHGLYPSRDAKVLYVTNRGSGNVTLIDFARRAVVGTWTIPGGGSPDMGGVSPDGKILWLSGRYNATVYALDTADGQLIGKIRVPNKPHGLCVWPQPGRCSLGHTGVMQ